MEILPVIRFAWRRRARLAAGLVCAVVVLLALGLESGNRAGALAWTRVALDTPRSQLVDVAPSGAGTLAWRASLLVHLMSSATSRDELARRLGVTTEQVLVTDPALSVPLVPSALPQAASLAASRITAPYTVALFLPNDSIPVISIAAEAPDPGNAGRLAAAAIAVLQSQASPGGRFASNIVTGGKRFTLQPFLVQRAAPVRIKRLNANTVSVKVIGASFFVFLAWCTAALGTPWLARRVRGRQRPLPV